MYSSIPALDIAPFNSTKSSVFLSPSLPSSLREQIAEAARTARNMTEADPDDLADEPDLTQVSSNAAAIVVPTQVKQAVQQLNERERTVQSLAKEWAGKPHKEILHRLGADLGSLVIKALQSQGPTLKQAFMDRERAVRAANADLGRSVRFFVCEA